MATYFNGRLVTGGVSGGGGSSAVTVAAIRSVLASANDTDRKDITNKLYASPEVLYVDSVASLKSLTAWTNILFSRALVGADNNKHLVIRIWNTRRTAEGSIPVRWFLELTPMAANTNRFGQRCIAIPFYGGDTKNNRTFTHGQIDPLYIGRPIETPQTTRRILLGMDGFGDEAQNDWRTMQIRVELRNLI